MNKIPRPFKQQIKGDYGTLLLAHLPSGKWTVIWHAAIQINDLFEATMTEDNQWFENQVVFSAPKQHATKLEALTEIVGCLEQEFSENTWGGDDNLKRAKAALRRETQRK